MPLAAAAVAPRLDCTTSQFSVCSIALGVYSAEIKTGVRKKWLCKSKSTATSCVSLALGQAGGWRGGGREKPAGSAALVLRGIQQFGFQGAKVYTFFFSSSISQKLSVVDETKAFSS